MKSKYAMKRLKNVRKMKKRKCSREIVPKTGFGSGDTQGTQPFQSQNRSGIKFLLGEEVMRIEIFLVNNFQMRSHRLIEISLF